DDALVAVDVAAHDRRARSHRFEQDDPERLLAGGRRRVDVGRHERAVLVELAHPAEQLYAREPSRGDVPANLALLRTSANDEQPRVDPVTTHLAIGLEQVREALAWLETADIKDVRRAVAPSREGHHVVEGPDVDAVGDDLVVARKVALDEVAGGRA